MTQNGHGATPRRVLVVDDEPMVCHAVRMMLEFDGHEVTTATAPETALMMFQPGTFDVVLTDFAMPGMNGKELIQAIRRISPSQPAAIITAYAEVLPPTGANLVIPKPFMLSDLRKALVELCPEDCGAGQMPGAAAAG